MELSSENDEFNHEANSPASLFVLMLSLFAVIIIFQFLIDYSEDWIQHLYVQGPSLLSTTYLDGLFNTIAYLAIYLITFA